MLKLFANLYHSLFGKEHRCLKRDVTAKAGFSEMEKAPDGKYAYKYIDARGARRSAYSWRLVETDKLSAGKRQCVPLLEIGKGISKDVERRHRYAYGTQDNPKRLL